MSTYQLLLLLVISSIFSIPVDYPYCMSVVMLFELPIATFNGQLLVPQLSPGLNPNITSVTVIEWLDIILYK